MAPKKREQLSKLIDQANDLESLAKRIQDPNEERPEELARELEQQYGSWYAKCHTLLPDDLLSGFKSAYEGAWYNGRIKAFIGNPLKPNPLYKEPQDNESLPIDPMLNPFNSRFREPLLEQRQALLNAYERMGIGSDIAEVLDQLQAMMERLPFALAALAEQTQGRDGISIRDEYDLQRVLHALLVLHFDDVRPEDYSPSRAGANTRIDFIIKDVRIAVEAKMTRNGLGRKELGNELAEDILRYKAHPDASALFAIIYDPSRKVLNPRGFERDINEEDDHFPVRAVIAQ
ncbi:PD-(D/E)XK nuclease domain-containing protein [Nocardiopsis halophila]|uniref:PD-(D/E)XK nuclease domain-containing protein n=1 Tax=Nocardiopsis halophila TaxID=141692 RepID=UPI001267BC6A|nr:hypothetical protein [Nocardiopsis halophila]